MALLLIELPTLVLKFAIGVYILTAMFALLGLLLQNDFSMDVAEAMLMHQQGKLPAYG